MSLEDWNIGFSHPCTIQISGPTGCGKTRFVRQVLENRLIEPFPTRLIWVYGEWQEDYEALRALYPHIEFVSSKCIGRSWPHYGKMYGEKWLVEVWGKSSCGSMEKILL